MSSTAFSLRDGQRELINGAVGNIELMFHAADPGGRFAGQGYAAVICHPHPLFAGTMDNKVVTTLVRAYCELGVATVRFNFRGVGATAGEHDHGNGEGDDLEAVAAWALHHADADRLLLAGFSFGSMVAISRYEQIAETCHLALIAPPLERFLESPPTTLSCPLTVVVAETDEVVDAEAALRWVESVESAHDLVLLAGASHFFHGRLTELREQLQSSIATLVAR